MNKKTLSRFGLLIVAILFVTSSFSQIKEIGTFTAGGVEDATTLMKAYITPWSNALGTSLSGGWYNTAKTHKPLGFDLTFTLNMGFVPSSDKILTTEELNDLELGLTINGTEDFQTAAGSKEIGPEFQYNVDDSITLASFYSPKGTGLGFIPTPMVQIGLGLVKGTDVAFRFIPKNTIGNTGELKLWGLGLKHDVLQWIPGISKAPVIHLAIQGGYTKFTLVNNISFLPEDVGLQDNTDAGTFEDQNMSLEVKSFTMNLLVSANLPVVCFYGGVGFARTKTTLGLNGFYPVPDPLEIITPAVTNESASEIEPMEIKNNSGGITKPRLNIGMRLKMGPITIHGDYTKANYSNVTVGLGLWIR